VRAAVRGPPSDDRWLEALPLDFGNLVARARAFDEKHAIRKAANVVDGETGRDHALDLLDLRDRILGKHAVAIARAHRCEQTPDLKTHLDGERTFVGLCFNRRPDVDTFSRLLANAAMASWDMQKEIPTMTVFAADGISKARVPLLFIYGGHDALVDTHVTLARAAELNPCIVSKVYAGSGHAPFIEEPDRFNHDLAEFVRSVSGQ